MAISKPEKIKDVTINTIGSNSFDLGLDERGAWNAKPNSIVVGRNVMINSSGNIVKRYVKKRWLPDTVGFNGELRPVYFGGEMYYFVADDGKIKYMKSGDSAWTDCGGDNDITTTDGLMTTFLRQNDCLIPLNGVDKLRYIDLNTLEMVKFVLIDDPVSTLTATGTGITTSGSYVVYYGYTYNGPGGGETAMSDILTQAISKDRGTWKDDGTEYLTISFNDTPSAGAESRNMYAAVAIEGSTPQPSDLVLLKGDIPLASADFVDNGSIPFDIYGGRGPSENSTDGIIARHGKDETGTAILYGDPNNPYTLYFSGNATDGVSFGVKNGAQRLELNRGTDYYPTSVIGFRNNQGLPNILALFNSTQGISKQQIISQKTLTYANGVINYWGADELNAGASSTSSPYATLTYLGKLLFPTSEGIVAIDTQAQIQNVLSSGIITDEVDKTYGSILSSNYEKIVATAANNKVFFAVPSRGYAYNNQIMVYDLDNPDKPKWYIWDIKADWIGSISPRNSNAFVYIRDGNKFYRLEEGFVTIDDGSTLTEYFPMVARGSLISSNQAKNNFYAISQAVIYVVDWVGDIDIEVHWYDDRGRHKSKTNHFSSGSYALNTEGGWDNTVYFNGQDFTSQPGWDETLPIIGTAGAQKRRARLKIRLPDVIANEMWFVISSNGNASWTVVNTQFEGVNIGIIGDMG